MSSTFFVPDGDGFVSTELTRGPWDPDAQHAGPPSALIGRELERLESPAAPDAEWQLGRITYEILRAVPIAPLRVGATVVRPGRKVELVSATLADGDGEVIRARGWRVARAAVEIPPGLASEDPLSPAHGGVHPGPERGATKPYLPSGQAVGYHTAIEYRFTAGGFAEPGPATIWVRMDVPLIPGEEPTPLQRVLVAADLGNGISSALELTRYLFINVDLTVQLHRLPVDEWVCVDAITIPEPTGIGLAAAELRDRRGPIGRALQTLLVRER